MPERARRNTVWIRRALAFVAGILAATLVTASGGFSLLSVLENEVWQSKDRYFTGAQVEMHKPG